MLVSNYESKPGSCITRVPIYEPKTGLIYILGDRSFKTGTTSILTPCNYFVREDSTLNSGEFAQNLVSSHFPDDDSSQNLSSTYDSVYYTQQLYIFSSWWTQNGWFLLR